MSKLKVRQITITTGGAQVYEGAGLLVGVVFDHHASSSGCVQTFYDSGNNASTTTQIYTRTSDTDAGTTVPVQLYTDGDLVAGTSTANVKAGIPFAQGLYVTKTGDTTHADVWTFLIHPLIKKSVNIATAGSAGSASGGASVFQGPGILHGIRIDCDAATPSTADITVKDSAIVGSGNTILTKTNYGSTTIATRPVVTLTGSDEAGNAVSTAATGAYASPGIMFLSGLNVNVAQSNALDRSYSMDFLIEA